MTETNDLSTNPKRKEDGMKRVTKLFTTPFVLAGLAGAAAEYFLDPHSGKRRRHVARDRFGAFFRRRGREVERKASYLEGVAAGAPHRVKQAVAPGDGKEIDDLTLTRKVESEVFRAADAPKGQVDVNTENGIVYLRGELKRREEIEKLVANVEKVEGVKGVKNLLHLPKTPAPNKEAARTT
jgi:hypothetical protein